MASIHNLSHALHTAVGDKAPLHLVANRASGSGEGGELAERLRTLCAEQGRTLTLHAADRGGDLSAAAAAAYAAAKRDGGVVVAAGGDGTVRTVAQALAGGSVPLAVVPVGTFNFFARNHAIPEDTEGALEVVLNGVPKAVTLGEVNEQVFLVNASFGLYAKAIARRERDTSRFGRNRAVVIASTVFSLLRGHPTMELELDTGDEAQRVRTPMVFVGNNALQLKDVALDVAHCMRDGRLAVVVLRPVGVWRMLRLAFFGLTGALHREESLESFCADRLRVSPRRRLIRVALDGELLKLPTPLTFRSCPAAIHLIVPPGGEGEEAGECEAAAGEAAPR
jgi:diacylglycerol kinase family enzyme